MPRHDPRDPQTKPIDRRPERHIERLRQSDQGAQWEALRTVGTFRVVDKKDIQNVDKLIANGYVKRDTLSPRGGGKMIEILTLSEKGKAALEQYREPDDKQKYWIGMCKPREASHDLAIYRAYKKERDKIEREDGAIKRVRMDFEFKSEINSRMNKPGPESKEERQKQIAAEYELPLIDDSVMLPDARIEFTRGDGSDGHVDLEVVTDAYRGRTRASKEASGFSLHYCRVSDGATMAGKGRRPQDDPHLAFLR